MKITGHRTTGRALLRALAAASVVSVTVFGGQRQDAPRQDSVRLLATSVPDGFTLAAVGDLLVQVPIPAYTDPGFTGMAKILRDADVTMGNMETSVIDMRQFKGYATSQGIAMTAPPAVAGDLKSLGFDLVSRANNHATNWGTEGILETDRHLNEAGLVHAGTGLSRSEARAARFFTTTNRGRVAFVSVASSFPIMARSSDPLGTVPGVPGLNALRTRRFSIVTPEMMKALRSIAGAFRTAGVGTGATWVNGVLGGADTTYATKPDELQLFGTYYREGEKPGFDYDMNEIDLREILASIRDGKSRSDFLIVSMHAHESPAGFVQTLARQAIDNGADAFVGHGPHRLLGIEIYKGKPIFYGLSNFFNQTALKEPVTLDEYERWNIDPATMTPAEFSVFWNARTFTAQDVYQAIIALSRYDHGQLTELRLYPVDLDFKGRPADRGTPRLAGPALAQEILKTIQKESEPYGTHVSIDGGMGVIRVGAEGHATVPQ